MYVISGHVFRLEEKCMGMWREFDGLTLAVRFIFEGLLGLVLLCVKLYRVNTASSVRR